MATKETGWGCTCAASITSSTNTSVTITVTSYWQNSGWTYDINYVSSKVYCGGSSYQVMSSGSVNTTSSTSASQNLGSHSFTINKTASTQSISCYATITSNSSYVSGTRTSSTITVSVPALTSYKVTYNANGGSGAPSSQTKYYGKTLTLSSTKPTRSGYTFVGWGTSTTDTTANYSAGGSYTSNAAITLYAIWKKAIKLTYNANGGSGAPSSQSATVYNATTSYKFTLSSTKPTRTGYTFLGWSTSSTATSSSYSAGGTITLSTSGTLYAVWKLNTYTVKYNANGGSGAPSSQTKTYGVTLTLSNTKPTRTSIEDNGTLTEYTFKGWATSSTATSVAYKAGASYTVNANLTLYAVWSKTVTVNLYDVSYNTNGGSEVISQIKVKGEALTLRDTIPVKNGYTFMGWGLSEDITTVSYKAGGSYTADEDVVLYAIWTPWTHTVKFNANGGIGNVPSSLIYTTGVDNIIIPECSLTKKGCVFKCWSTQPSGSSGTNYYVGDGYTGVKNGGTVTLYAIWNATDVYLYNTGECRASEFIEDENYSFNNDGTVHYIEFIEGSSSMNLNPNAFYVVELLERIIVDLVDETDIYLTDEEGNILTTII